MQERVWNFSKNVEASSNYLDDVLAKYHGTDYGGKGPEGKTWHE